MFSFPSQGNLGIRCPAGWMAGRMRWSAGRRESGSCRCQRPTHTLAFFPPQVRSVLDGFPPSALHAEHGATEQAAYYPFPTLPVKEIFPTFSVYLGEMFVKIRLSLSAEREQGHAGQ